MLEFIGPASGLLFTLENIFWINIGVFIGSVFAAIPGLTVILCVILFLPFTYQMTAIPGMMFLLGIYCAGGYGGSVSAILINTPGTPHAAATMLDGHPLSKQGRTKAALKIALYASTFGGVFSALMLLFLGPQVARVAAQLGTAEYFMVCLFGLTIIAGVSGKSMIKGIISACIGLLLSCVGTDPMTGYDRLTFGIGRLYMGLDLAVCLIGLFALVEILAKAELKPDALHLDAKKMEEETQKVIDELHLHLKADQLVGELSIGMQQLVEIIKAVSAEARIVVMDEPTSSLSQGEVETLFGIIRLLQERKVGIIYISHRLEELFAITDRIVVLRDGRMAGDVETGRADKDELIRMMVGRELTNYYTRDYLTPGDVILKCEHISDGKMAKDASFELRKGEIIGFAGLVGAGRSETMKAVFGLAPHMTGDVYVEGQKVQIKSPVDALKYGIALVPESRKEEGLYKVQSVRFNSTIEVLSQFIKSLHVNAKKEEEITQKYIDMMATKTPSQEQVIGNLSGGNQQKVMIGRWLATDPKILILDEPTRGVDVGAKAEIYALMEELLEQGKSIIMISSELTEVMGMSDRLFVMKDGKIVAELWRDDFDEQRILTYALEGSEE